MLQLILMLLGLAFSNNNGNTTSCDNNSGIITVQSDDDPGTGINPGGGIDPGDTGGDTGQTPPKK